MANYETLIASIKDAIKNNNKQAITGQVLQDTLLSMTETEQEQYSDVLGRFEYKTSVITQADVAPFSNSYITSAGALATSGRYSTYKFSTENINSIEASLRGDRGDCVLAFYNSETISSASFMSAYSYVLSATINGDISITSIPSDAKLVAISFKSAVYPDCTFSINTKEPRIYDLLRSLSFIENDQEGNITWADGSSGVLSVVYNEDALAIESFVATHSASGYKVEQPTITFDDDFAIINRPKLTITKIS